MGNAAKAQFVPDMNIDDKGEFQNSFVELGLVVSGDPSNSRVTFSVGFEAIFQQVGSANFVLKDDGTLEVVSSDMPNSIPVVFTHTVEHKIRNADVEQIKNIANTATDVDDDIADDPAYLLDKNGYMLYRFNPLFNESRIKLFWNSLVSACTCHISLCGKSNFFAIKHRK